MILLAVLLIPLVLGVSYDDCEIYGNCISVSNISTTDTDTTYTAGTNLTLVGTEFGANMTSLKDWFDLFYSAGSSIYPHDQDLNTTDNVTFKNVSITQNLTVGGYANISKFITHEGLNVYEFHSENDDVHLELPDLGGNNFFGIETTGGFFQLYANPNPANDYLLATISETQGADTEINFYEGGTTHNRFWDSGSARFGGGPSRLCTNLTDMVDCDTSLTGADVVIQDELWTGGGVFFSNGSFNVSDEGNIDFDGLATGDGGGLTNVSANTSNYWDGLDTYNTTSFEEQSGGILGIKFSWLTTFVQNLLEWDDLINVPTNINDTNTITYSKRNVNSDGYIQLGAITTSATVGYRMNNSGSLLSVTHTWRGTTSVPPDTSLYELQVRVNGIESTALSKTINVSGSGKQWASVNYTNSTFGSGDVVTCYVDKLDAGGGFMNEYFCNINWGYHDE